nr:hypothetical protein [uncultured Mediterranean phage uvMED]BAR25756.1 hypothetical protein [uncultured Mediterranean phage uvMED]
MLVKDNALDLSFNLADSKAYQTIPMYNYWKGWWAENPRNSIEEVIKLLWEDLINPDDYLEGGFEYWARAFEDLGSLEWHQDTCESHYVDDKYLIADKSLVYYVEVSSDLCGGVMEIAPYRDRLNLEAQCKSALNVDTEAVERITPKQNRFILIDSAQMHRVTRIHKGIRKNLVSSIWKQTPKLFQEHENWNRIFVEEQKMEKINWLEKRSN